MMNASFRTAFWAMCLGLTIPMMLFVGVELTSGGRASVNRKVASAMTGSLRSRWNVNAAPTTGAAPSGIRSDAGKSSDGSPLPTFSGRPPVRRQQSFEGAKLIPMLEPDSTGSGLSDASSGVVLSPQLEADPTAPELQPGVRPRFPAIPTGTRPRAEIIPDELAAALPQTANRIETRLDEIVAQLDHMAGKLADRLPTSDPMQQATELLLRLQQARQVQELAARLPLTPPPEPPPEATPPAQQVPVTNLPVPSQPVELPPTVTNPIAPTPTASTPPAPLTPLTKIYRPRYIAVRALEALATPLLTAGVGRIGAASNESEAIAGDMQGQLPTQWDALVVRDTPDVLRKIDRLVRELDIPPVKVLIEATVVNVRLVPSMPYGVDLGEFNHASQPFSIHPADLSTIGAWGNSVRTTYPPGSIPTLTHGTGVKCGILRGDVRAFLQVLQAATQIRGTSASQTTVVNKQTTEFLLGEGFAAAADGARPLSSGTILRVRPIATRDGLIHLEVRPVFGTESVSWAEGITAREGSLGNQLTLRPGETAVISGFVADHLVTYSYNKSGAGELPFVGQWFRGEAGVLQRTETIVLLTPHLAEVETPVSDAVSSGQPAKLRPAAKRLPANNAKKTQPQAMDQLPAGPEQRPAQPTAGRTADALETASLPVTATPQSASSAGEPSEPGGGSGQIRQASATTTAEIIAKKLSRTPARRRGARRIPPYRPDPSGLDAIPEIPIQVDEPKAPVIRPATSPRSRNQ